MKKILQLLMIIASTALATTVSAQATWNASEDENWNNPANWTWEGGGSGVPTSTTNVTLVETDLGGPYILEGDTAYCNNLYFSYLLDSMLGDNSLNLWDNAVLKINGNISKDPSIGDAAIYSTSETLEMSSSSIIIFSGTSLQNIDISSIMIGKVYQNNPANVKLSNGVLFLMDSFYFQQSPVSAGSPSLGNFILDGGALIMDSRKAKLPTYTSLQNPPHFIAAERLMFDSEEPSTLFMSVIVDPSIGFIPITGTFTLPLGPSAKSYTPITITDDNGYVWMATVSRTVDEACLGSAFNTKAVKNYYDIQPLQSTEDGDMIPVSTTEPLSITLTYNSGTDAGDLGSAFDESVEDIYLYGNYESCFNQLPGDVITEVDGNYRYMTHSNHTQFPTLILSQLDTTLAPPTADSVVVTTIGGAPAIINTPAGSLPLKATVYPIVADQDVIWSIAPGTGSASISASGVVSAISNGIVTAKATVVADPSLFDEFIITISNQPTSINPYIIEYGYSLFPNPAETKLNIVIQKSHPAITLNIYDVTGKVLLKKDFAANELNDANNIDLSSFQSGIYLVKIVGEKINILDKFVKK